MHGLLYVLAAIEARLEAPPCPTPQPEASDMRFLAIVFVFSLTLSSCASIISGGHDTLTVTSAEKGTSIYVDGVLRGTDSIQAEVKRGHRHTLRAEKEGFNTVTIETSESWDPTSLLGILIDFGIVTIPLDFLMGGCWKTEPTLYTVTPTHQGSAPPAKP